MQDYKTMSADELLVEEGITEEQKIYLTAYCDRWDKATEDEQAILVDEYAEWLLNNF